MTYTEALEYLDSLTRFGIKFGMERITALSDAFGNPHRKLRVVHVGGTNGKGSTCTFISSILHKSGYSVGSYFSPHVFDVRERIQVNGQPISVDEFAEIVGIIKPIADKISAGDLGHVTQFELKTMAAYLCFARRVVDFAVLEVGMGGRFDATNLVSPLVSVITNVTLDHTERLGNTIEEIAFEKAGIIKNGSIVVTAAQDRSVLGVISQQCAEEDAQLWWVIAPGPGNPGPPVGDVQVRCRVSDVGLSVRASDWSHDTLKPGLLGAFQLMNAAVATTVAEALRRCGVKLTDGAICDGIASACIPGRLEVLLRNPTLVIDGAHNPDAAAKLADTLPRVFSYRRLILVIGMLSSHSPGGVLSTLLPLAATVIATQSTWVTAIPAEKLATLAKERGAEVETVPSVPAAVERALALAGPEDLVLVTGSFYTIGEVPECYRH